jgi:hypothetical protein
MGIKSRLAGIAFAAAMVSLQILPSSGQTKARPVPSVDLTQLAHMRGPKKPAGAVFVGKDPQPMIGETKLPIQNVDVYQFPVKTQRGVVVNVKWAYTQGQGTYMWATAPFQCGDGTLVANGSYAMRVKEDGTGGYILGTNACPNGQVYGCQFDANVTETACGACGWNNTEIACVTERPGASHPTNQ